jgi:CO dehydrogenase maturation factor
MRTIITAGKGGTGKSMAMAYLLKHHIGHHDTGRVLVIDADPHGSLTNIIRSWGDDCEMAATLGALRHQHDDDLRRGENLKIGRTAFANLLVQQAITRLSGGIHLLGLGKNDQPGCQCVTNTLLGRALDALRNQYDLILVDNEAGIEHIGRHAWPVDVLLLFATPRRLDLDVAGQIVTQVQTVGREITHTILVCNRVRGDHCRDVSRPFAVDHIVSLPYTESLETNEQPDEHWIAGLGELWQMVGGL